MDLFAGCGGLTRGFLDSRKYRAVFAVECDEDAAATYEANFGDHVFCGPIERVEEFPKVDVIVGGPPCQGFSPLNMRGVGLERRTLWREYLRALEEAQPDAFLMENVPQLLRSAEYAAFKRAAEELGFEIADGVLNAADFGVPQTRRRAIAIGVSPRRTRPAARQVRPGAGGSPGARSKMRSATCRRQPTDEGWHNSRNPPRSASSATKRSPARARDASSWPTAAPTSRRPAGCARRSGSTDVFGRLWWDRPAFTIRTEFFKPEKGRYLHPSEHRPITVREAARLHELPGRASSCPPIRSMTSIGKQIGNAVPPLLARRLGEALAAHIAAARADSALPPPQAQAA